MNRRLGVSIYPEKSTLEKDKEYIELAGKYNFKRVFTCLLSITKNIDIIKQELKEIIIFAKEKGLEVILDVAPNIFEELGISYNDLSFFAELGADGIRLDLGFDSIMESKLTYNEYGLKIELNLSNDVDYLNNILSYKPNKENLYGCHNFYPQKYTGLEYDFFIRSTKRFKENNIRTAAFISCKGELGPWSINDGLSTLEEHRGLPLETQAKHLWATELIDDVIIGDAYATEKQLKKLSELNPYIIELEVEVEEEISEKEKEILLSKEHYRRGDISKYMIRSTEIRKKHKESYILERRGNSQERGDILIGNNSFGKYKGELQIVLERMEEDKRKNLVGRVVPYELFLLNYIGPWNKFTLKIKSEN